MNFYDPMIFIHEWEKGDLPKYDDVFLVTQAWGDNAYHWMMEEMPRLVPWIEFLKDNKKVTF